MNTDLKEILQKHRARYPKMLLQDEIKLIYQHILGRRAYDRLSGGLSLLSEERDGPGPFPAAEGIEDIGNGRVRPVPF